MCRVVAHLAVTEKNAECILRVRAINWIDFDRSNPIG